MTTPGEGHGEPAATEEPRRSSRLEALSTPHGSPAATPAPRKLNPQLQRMVPDTTAEARREFAVLLGEFRRTPVLVPLASGGGLWTADFGGVRWICAFSHEAALSRFAHARGEAHRTWEYRTVLGARLLDVMVPTLGVPAGVALDAGSDDGALFPPVRGVVPDTAAIDLEDGQDDRHRAGGRYERDGGRHER
ncbi:SseB family protein [Streptomyces sp. enrichment culture]|uniref:SseB family protein n=1 Tax=Streptomyces sp. enrichment culture TaxID=1795815 RepID=UPI003F559ACE